jgi:hypothetical protein
MHDRIHELETFTPPEPTITADLTDRIRRRGTRMRRRRNLLASIGGLAAVGILATPLAWTHTDSGTSDPGGVAAAPARPGSAMTELTLDARFCEGCTFQLTQALADPEAPGGVSVWHSDEVTVRGNHGEITFTVPKSRTRGMSITFDAPWEGQLPGASTVVMGYQGHTNDPDVGVVEATNSKMGSACWAGTQADHIRIGVATEKVQVDGVHGPVTGTLAFLYSSMNEVLPPMREVTDGVMSSQDINICGTQP